MRCDELLDTCHGLFTASPPVPHVCTLCSSLLLPVKRQHWHLQQARLRRRPRLCRLCAQSAHPGYCQSSACCDAAERASQPRSLKGSSLAPAAGETEEEAAAKRARLESEARAGAAAGPTDEQHAAGQARGTLPMQLGFWM